MVYGFKTFHAILSYCLKTYANLPLMVSATEEADYSSFMEKVCRYCSFVEKQDERYIAIELSSPIEYAAAYMGIVLSGRIACLIPEGQTLAVIDEPCSVINDEIAEACFLEPIQSIDAIDSGDPEKPCTAVFSSDTSAEPKCILLSQKGILASALYGGERYGFRMGERLVHVLPYWHLFGFAADLIAPMAYGSCICMPDSPIGFFRH